MWDEQWGYRGARKEGLDFFVEHMTWKRLPQSVYDSMGGREAAKAKRIEVLGINAVTGTGGPAVPVSDATTVATVDSTAAAAAAAESDGGAQQVLAAATTASVDGSGEVTVPLPTTDVAAGAEVGESVKTEPVSNRKRTRSEELSGSADSATKIAKKLKMLLPPLFAKIGKQQDRTFETVEAKITGEASSFVDRKVASVGQALTIIDLIAEGQRVSSAAYSRVSSVTWTFADK